MTDVVLTDSGKKTLMSQLASPSAETRDENWVGSAVFAAGKA